MKRDKLFGRAGLNPLWRGLAGREMQGKAAKGGARSHSTAERSGRRTNAELANNTRGGRERLGM